MMKMPESFRRFNQAVLLGVLSAVSLSPRISAGAQPGSLDTSLNPGVGIDQSVFSMAVQGDGKILIGGDFVLVNQVPRNGIARLNSDGLVDPGFDPGLGADDLVSAVAIQSNKVIIAGYFTTVNGMARGSIARLNSNGSLDSGFDPGTGADGPVLALAVQSDGKVLLGGQFTTFNSVPRGNVARLNSDGSVDSSFDPGAGVAGESFSTVNALALQSDGKVILGGTFTNVSGVSRSHVARLHANGSLDAAFNPAVGVTGAGLLAGINALGIQSDGNIVLGGDFTSVGGMARTNLARLNTNGSVDLNFNPGTGADSAVSSLAVQSNGKIVISGFFTHVNGTVRNYVARLNSGGTLDTGFDPGLGANDAAYVTSLQADGKVLIGGAFTSFNGTPRDGIARLEGDLVVPRPRLMDPFRTGSTFRVSVATVPGRSYALEFKNALTDAAWTALAPVPGDGTIKILQDTGATGPQRLYRVQTD